MQKNNHDNHKNQSKSQIRQMGSIMSEEREIPIGWANVELGQLCLDKEGLRRGPFGSAIKKEFFIEDGFKVYEQSNAIYDDVNRGKYFISEKKYQELANFNVQPNDLIVSCSGTLGKIAHIPKNAKPGIINQALLRIRLISEIIDTKYFLYFFRSAHFQRKIFDQSQGTAMSNLIGIKDFKLIELLLPPLPEQHRIVAKIEELFSSLDKGIESLKMAQAQLKVYRQAVLKWAFEGKLTNIDVKEGELPEGWKWKKLKDIGTWRGGGTPSKNNPLFWNAGNILWVTPKDMKSQRIIDTINKITVEAIENSSTKLIPENSILIVVRSGILRRTLPIAIAYQRVCLNQDMQAITPSHDSVDYIFWALQSCSQSIRNNCSKDGTTVESIESNQLKEFSIPIATLSEQQLIVSEIESRLSVCDKIEESISTSLLQAEALRQSILKKAFEGKLVEQDPNDEPASVLMERIKAERETNKPVKKMNLKN